MAGVLFLNPFRESLVYQRERALAVEAQLMAEVFEASLPRTAPANLLTGDGIDPVEVLSRVGVQDGVDVFVFAPNETLVASTAEVEPKPARPVAGIERRRPVAGHYRFPEHGLGRGRRAADLRERQEPRRQAPRRRPARWSPRR